MQQVSLGCAESQEKHQKRKLHTRLPGSGTWLHLFTSERIAISEKCVFGEICTKAFRFLRTLSCLAAVRVHTPQLGALCDACWYRLASKVASQRQPALAQ